ncbi:hypothetical protein L1049_005247 [Liquidambar formosana]|uniref:Uncharacterized protein n=1 Tax=Liquidambar formosana TaxID=63359 RepID=A0AAP0RQB0_LIQFO
MWVIQVCFWVSGQKRFLELTLHVSLMNSCSCRSSRTTVAEPLTPLNNLTLSIADVGDSGAEPLTPFNNLTFSIADVGDSRAAENYQIMGELHHWSAPAI